jgi:hypothetical protein
MTGDISLEWIKHFDKHTAEKAGGAARLLLVDGHISHYTLEVLNYARDHKIIMVCYPAHSTHVFQGLDVACFGRLKELYSKYAADYEDKTGQKITKDVFLTPFSQAYIETFTPDTIKSAFLNTGVYPFNRDILTAKDIAPSLATSVQSGLPIELPEGVSHAARIWDIDKGMLERAAMEDEEEINSGAGVWSETEGANMEAEGDARAQGGSKDTFREVAGEVEDRQETASMHADGPQQDKPSYCNPFHAALASTTAAFLIGDSRITSHDNLDHLPFYRLPTPPVISPSLGEPSSELELCLAQQLEEFRRRDEAMVAAYRGAQAQLVLADRHCSLLQGQLNAKETSAAARREGKGKGKLMGDGLPRVLTQGTFYDQCVENRRLEEAAQEAKRQREIKNAEVKRIREDWNEQEQARKTVDREAYRIWKEGPLAEWEAEKALRKAEGRRARWTRPKAPQRSKPIPKPWLAQEVAEEPEGAEGAEAAEGGGDVEGDSDDEDEDESENE